ncbi:hypothetical protein CkaCkLH20_00193 [Colletotrichum karsti]|uniref:Uncharacterized protein n=1 Tax=Colletotrichum karsti TaxID=1095194 RepID=A0A9P6IGN5_9PEZI|nr:uncharacterized protein CkaCkLH20_00193 [Colletotrichum karsti]KAF9882157.1 hypothetical protein CkaCkLH20_00193 [Colletotrichum karsti]
MPNIHNFIPDPDGPSTFAPNNPFLIAGRDASHQTPDNDEARTVLPTIENQETRASMEHSSVLESENQRVFFEADEQWRTRPSVRKRKTCEQRRLELCVEFDEAKFDAAIYGQPEASKPPAGVTIPADPIYHGPAPAAGEAPKPFYMRIDPRIHWPHDFSDEWYARKIKEVLARGGRKANFGKATQRMREQRIAEERLEAQEAAEKAAAEREGEETPSHNPPVPWSHRRPMDFGDVPEDELPSYVQNNKDWLRAAASMRENRQRTLQANALQAAGKPWEHLFLKDKNGRYINQHNEADE